MTRPLVPSGVASLVNQVLPGAVVEAQGDWILVKKEQLQEVARFLKETPELQMDFLASITGVDYLDYFEVVYHLVSIAKNHSLVVKARCWGRDNPSIPSLTPLWQGADLQEREVYDLMGISFEGHPRMKRIFLWEGFQGHPLRRDFVMDKYFLPE